MPKSTPFNIRDIYTIDGTEIAAIYEQNKMAVHFQGMSKCLLFPQTVALRARRRARSAFPPTAFTTASTTRAGSSC